MANSKISALTSATTPLAGTETLPIVQSSTTKQVSVVNLTSGRAVSMLSATVGPNALALSGAVVDIGNDRNSPTRVGISNQNSGGSATAGIDFESAGGGWQIDVPADVVTFANPLIGKFGGTEQFRFTADGNYVPKTAAKGVNFTANTPAAGMTSQLLNWYEEGTYTPSQGGGLTVVGTFGSSGTYTRIGRQVTVIGTLTGSTSIAFAAAGGILTGGLPFNLATYGGGQAFNGGLSAGMIIAGDGGSSIYGAGTIASTGRISFTFTYFV